MKNKRGTHVGVVLSFILFLTFLTFMFAMIRFPFSIEQKKEVSLDLIKENIIESLSSDVTTILIANTSVNVGEDCLRMSETDLTLAGDNFISKDKDLNTFNSKRESGILYVDWTDSQSFFKIYYTPSGFTLYSSLTCTSSGNAEIKNIKQSEEIFESKIIEKLYEYSSDYEALKEEIGVSTTNEFKFQFEYENQTTIGENMTDIKTNIYLKKYQIDYFDVDGNKEIGGLLVYLW